MTNLFLYIPSAFSIYLILISGVASNYLRASIREYVKNKSNIKPYLEFLYVVAEDWAERLGFINSMILSFISVLSAFAESQSYLWAGVALVVLVFIFTPTFFWVFSHQPSKLVGTKFPPPFAITHAQLCQIVLIVVNLAIMGAIFLNQQLKNQNIP
jgi:hypothetical protein